MGIAHISSRRQAFHRSQISLILLIQAGRAGMEPIRLRWCAPAQNKAVLDYDNDSSQKLHSPYNRLVSPAPSPFATGRKRLLRAAAKRLSRQKLLFCACGERIPAIAGLCSKCYQMRRHSRDYFADNRKSSSSATTIDARAAGQGTRNSTFITAGRD